jgi:hypothetical protein
MSHKPTTGAMTDIKPPTSPEQFSDPSHVNALLPLRGKTPTKAAPTTVRAESTFDDEPLGFKNVDKQTASRSSRSFRRAKG